MSQAIKIVVEKHSDNYVAYPLGVRGAVVGEGAALGVVDLKTRLAPRFNSVLDLLREDGLDVAAQRPTDEAGRVGVLDKPGHARFGAGDANTHRGHRVASTYFLFGTPYQRGDRRDRRRIVALRRGHAFAQQLRATRVKRNDLDLGAAKIDAEPHHASAGPPQGGMRPRRGQRTGTVSAGEITS